MSSNIKVTRHCSYCENLFVARTTFTKYCSAQCNKRHYKLKQREEKVLKSDIEIHQNKVETIANAFNGYEIFTVKKEAGFLKA